MTWTDGRLLGIMSDSHGHARRVRAALHLFDHLGVDEIIHCGDVGGQAILDEFVGRPFRFIWGNTDTPDAGVLAYLQSVDLPEPPLAPLRIESAGKTILVFHGYEPAFRAALDAQSADYILHGHTHTARDERIGATRVINPGALYRASVHSVATLDPVKDVVTFYDVDRSAPGSRGSNR